MLVHKKFKAHPYRLRALEMIFLAAYIVDIYRILLEFNLRDVFDKLLDLQCYTRGQQHQCEENPALFESRKLKWSSWLQFIWMQMFLITNLILNRDMHSMMKNPFKPPRLRTKNYYIFCSLVFLASVILVQLFNMNWNFLS